MRARCAKCGKYMKSGSGLMQKGKLLEQMVVETHRECGDLNPPSELGMEPCFIPMTRREREDFLTDPLAYTVNKINSLKRRMEWET